VNCPRGQCDRVSGGARGKAGGFTGQGVEDSGLLGSIDATPASSSQTVVSFQKTLWCAVAGDRLTRQAGLIAGRQFSRHVFQHGERV
jgi:hypothetical protein